MTDLSADRVTGGVGLNFLKLGGGEVVARLVAFAATVYLARTLGATTYGVIVLAITVMLYFAVITDCGIEALGIRDVSAAPDALATMLPDILGARLLIGGSLTVLATLLGVFVLPQPEGAILAAYSFSMLMTGMNSRWAHLGLQQTAYASFARVLSELLSAGLIVAIVRGPSQLGLIPVTQVAGEAAGAFMLLHLLPNSASRLPASLHLRQVPRLLRNSWPLVLHALLGLAIFNSDFIVLRAFRDSATVGTYAAAYTLISFFLNLGATYTMSMLPVITRVRDDLVSARRLFDGSMAQVLAGAVPVAVGGFLVAEAIIQFVFGAEYRASAIPLQILLWSIPVAVVRNVAQAVLIAYGRTDEMLRTVVWAAGVNLLLNVVLIPPFGMEGAAAATLTTECARTVLILRYTRRAGLPIAAPVRFARVAGAAAAMGAVVWMLGHQPLALLIAAGGTTYVGALALFGAFRFRRNGFPEFAP